MSTCTACQTVNPEGTRYCTNCGQALASAPPLEVSNESPAYTPPPAYAPPPVAPAYAAARPTKDKSIALILEILPGLFGFVGFGWIYAGNTTTGIILLVAMLVWSLVALIINIFTAGLGCFCTIPISLVVVSISAYFLNDYTKKHAELFG